MSGHSSHQQPPSTTPSRARTRILQPSLPADLPHWFSTEKQWRRYQSDFESRELMEPKFLDRSTFEGTRSHILPFMDSANLLDFVCCDRAIYPHLVKVFYANLRVIDNVLFSEVNKIRIELPMDLFGSVLKLPAFGHNLLGGISDWAFDSNGTPFSEALALATIHHSGIKNNKNRPQVSGLPVDKRIVHYMLTHTLIPRSGNHSVLTKDDSLMLWALAEKHEINWALSVMHHMRQATSKGSALPYGIHVTAILRHFRVPFNNEVKWLSKGNWKIDYGCLAKMHIFLNDDNIFEYDVPEGNRARKRPAPSSVPSTSTSAGPSSNLSQSQMDLIMSGFDAMNVFMVQDFACLQSMQRTLHRLDMDIGAICSHLHLPRFLDPSAAAGTSRAPMTVNHDVDDADEGDDNDA